MRRSGQQVRNFEACEIVDAHIRTAFWDKPAHWIGTDPADLEHAADGTVHARQELRVNGHRVVPLSLVRLSPQRLAISTLDGRLLVCSFAVRPSP